MVLAIALLAGCRSPTGRVAGTTLGAVLVGTMIYGLAYCTQESCGDDASEAILGTTLLVLATVWLVGEAAYDPEEAERERLAEAHRAAMGPGSVAPPPPEPARPDLVEPVSPHDPRAQQLTRQALSAALREDCATVRSLGKRVESLDVTYHARVFRANATIARCL